MMKTLGLVLLASGVAMACNGGPPTDPDCQNHDLGSCGTACCKMLFTYKNNTPTQVKAAIFATLANGGPDGRYAWQTTSDGTFGFSADYNYEQFHYLGQAYHTSPMPGKYVTSGPYRDTVNFMIFSDPMAANVTTLRVFSLSDINGALGDNGMNYKNIMLAMKAVPLQASSTKHEDNSCPAPKN
eukprot:TRINITY_DN199_c0_g1_i3.p1 TRINITY_DN199_c0_g1~~TRINITY_DN199_c0_g1_i3.p1  ORF type:complete len:184 (+),score=49.39 TRINITY_DN199_c0_g1_i3:108-659(+)